MIITEIQYFFSKIIRFQAIFKDTVEFTCALEFKISSQLWKKNERTMIFMARSTKSYEERMLQLEKKEQESLEKAKQYAAQKRELKKRQKDVETKKRTHRLCQIGGAVESVLGSAIEEEDIPKLIGFLKRQEANGKFFSKAMQKEPVANTEEV